MDPIDQLQRNSQNLVILDESNTPVLRIGMRAVFYLMNGWRPERRQAIATFHDAYMSRYGDHLRRQTNPKTDRFSPIRANSITLPGYLAELPEGEGYSMILHSGAKNHEAPLFSFETLANGKGLHPKTYVATSCSIDAFLTDIDGYVAQFDDAVRTLSPIYAHADLCILTSPNQRDMYQHIEYAWAQRAWGLDVEAGTISYGFTHSGQVPKDLERWGDLPEPRWLQIKGFNWLVYLNGGCCDRLGSAATLQRDAHDIRDLRVQTLNDGLRLRAGDTPQIVPHSPSRSAEVPEVYTGLSELVKPLRTDGLPLAQGTWFEHLVTFNERTSRLWQARFDRRDDGEPAPWPGPLVGEGTEEDIDLPVLASTTAEPATPAPGSVMAPAPCPRTGWWFTPAQAGSRRYVKAGETLPEIVGSDYGQTFWQWDINQASPTL